MIGYLSSHNVTIISCSQTTTTKFASQGNLLASLALLAGCNVLAVAASY